MFSVSALNQKLPKHPVTFTEDERGLTTVEYVIVLVLIAVGAITLWRNFGGAVNTKINDSTTQMTGMTPATPAGNKPGG